MARTSIAISLILVETLREVELGRAPFVPNRLILHAYGILMTRSPVPASSDGRGSFEPRLYRFGCEAPRRSVGDSRTAPAWITLLHVDDRIDEFCTRSFRAGLPTAI